MRYDPGADAAERYPDWVIRRRRLGWGIPEVLCRRTKVILLESSEPPAARRCHLAHAIAHLDLGHSSAADGRFDRRQEDEAHLMASRRLIALEDLVRVACWTQDFTEAAAELDVDEATLNTRLGHLHPSERARVRFALRRLEETA